LRATDTTRKLTAISIISCATGDVGCLDAISFCLEMILELSRSLAQRANVTLRGTSSCVWFCERWCGDTAPKLVESRLAAAIQEGAR